MPTFRVSGLCLFCLQLVGGRSGCHVRDMTFSLVVAWPVPTRDEVRTPPTTQQWALQPGRCPAHYYFPGVKRMAFCRGKAFLGCRPGQKNQSRSGFRAEGVQTRISTEATVKPHTASSLESMLGSLSLSKHGCLPLGRQAGTQVSERPINPETPKT